MSILVGKHIDQRAFDSGQHQRTLPVLLGEHRARTLDRAAIVAMYVVVAIAVAVGAVTPLALLVLFAAPRALRAVRVMSEPARTSRQRATLAGRSGLIAYAGFTTAPSAGSTFWGSRQVRSSQARGWARDMICIKREEQL